jgi:leucyl aminopeptidase
MTSIVAADGEGATPIRAVTQDRLEALLGGLDAHARRFVEAQGFKAEAGRHVLIPDRHGNIGAVLLGLGGEDSADARPLLLGKIAPVLPAQLHRLDDGFEQPDLSALAFALAVYRFDRYRQPKEGSPRLALPDGVELAAIDRIRNGVYLARDLINTPANDLSPQGLADAARELAAKNGATIEVIEGDGLRQGFPMIHAVGAASDRPPCLIDMRWGSESDPRVTLIGKGIVFDTGGLDIKPSTGMALMKKDMGGAANVLGLASMIMDAELKVRLRVLIPAAENVISGRAFRPGDILKSRKGLTVEIGNTDAEGRLVLADAMALADEETPDLMVTMATLTGAARVALGPEVPAFFTDDASLAEELGRASTAVHDPIWRLPLWKPYDSWLSSKTADLNNIAGNAFAGSIVAALFLKRFVSRPTAYAHFDIYAWNTATRPLGPEGGEAQAIRALYRLLSLRHG